MGEVFRMSIAEETRNRISNLPYRNRDAESIIRKEGIIKLIKSKESGHLFSTKELIKAAGYTVNNYKDKNYQRATNLLYYMIKNGIIKRIPEPGTIKSSYVVMDDVKLGRKKRGPNKNKIVNRKIEDLTKVVKKDVKEITADSLADNSILDTRSYNITFTIDKKIDTEYGKKSIAKIELNDTTLDIAKEMIIKTIEVSK